MYYEGKAYPCGETPPAAASVIMDWMVMEWGDVIRIFPGIDDAMVTDAAFARLLTPGGFEVAAKRADNATMFVQITNAHGVAAKDVSILSVHVDAMPLPWTAVPTTVKYAARKDADGTDIVDVDVSTLPRNTTVTFYSAAAVPAPASLTITPSTGGNHSDYNYWGLPRGGSTPPHPSAPNATKCFQGKQCAAHFSGNGYG